MPIIVNNYTIADDDIHAEMQYHPAGTVDEARYKASLALVIRQLFLCEAREQKILNPDLNGNKEPSIEEETKAIDELIAKEVTVPDADTESCKFYYKNNLGRFLDKKTGKQLPLEMVIEHIRNYLYARSLQTGINQYIKILAGRVKIIGFDLDEANSPLVQ